MNEWMSTQSPTVSADLLAFSKHVFQAFNPLAFSKNIFKPSLISASPV